MSSIHAGSFNVDLISKSSYSLSFIAHSSIIRIITFCALVAFAGSCNLHLNSIHQSVDVLFQIISCRLSYILVGNLPTGVTSFWIMCDTAIWSSCNCSQSLHYFDVTSSNFAAFHDLWRKCLWHSSNPSTTSSHLHLLNFNIFCFNTLQSSICYKLFFNNSII